MGSLSSLPVLIGDFFENPLSSLSTPIPRPDQGNAAGCGCTSAARSITNKNLSGGMLGLPRACLKASGEAYVTSAFFGG